MKETLIKVFLLVFVFLGSNGATITGTQDSKLLKGSYLGQDPPGKKPEIFAQGFVSTSEKEFSITFSPDGKECYFWRRILRAVLSVMNPTFR